MQITKRNGDLQTFNSEKIKHAVQACFKILGRKDASIKAAMIANRVESFLETSPISASFETGSNFKIPSVEEIQNLVEEFLVQDDEMEAYQEYATYRKERETVRRIRKNIPDDVKVSFAESKKYFPTALQEWQFFDKTSRFNHDEMRRETWVESVKRSTDFLKELSGNKLSQADYQKIHDYQLEMKAMSSFRLLAMAGPAARRDNTCLYNCSFIPIGYVPYSDLKELNSSLIESSSSNYLSLKDPVRSLSALESFVEVLHISMCGCGVGVSVEEFFTCRLPKVLYEGGFTSELEYLSTRVGSKQFISTHIVEDDTEGWGNALRIGLKTWFSGDDIIFDYSKVREEGAVLKIKGGRASGPKPLKEMLDRVRSIILGAQGRSLYSDEISDIVCCIGECAVSGGVRRTAIIIVYDFGDVRMRNYKQGNWYPVTPWRSNANISEAFVKIYDHEEVDAYVSNMHSSSMGEPGIFSRINAIMNAPSRRKQFWESEFSLALGYDFKITLTNCVLVSLILGIGVNPCGEINLTTFCNLTAAVARKGDSFKELCEKVRVATMIGTIQSCGTHFPNLRPHWKEISEKERLLGVDIIGQADYGFLSEEECCILCEIAVETNVQYAAILEIPQSNAVTTVKPGGNSSVLLDASSSISRRKYKFAKRNVEVSKHTPVYKVLKHSKVPGFAKPLREETTYLFSFLIKAPSGAETINTHSLEDQLNYWLRVKTNYTEHNPSCSIYYAERELEFLKKWIYENQMNLGGLAFFPQMNVSENAAYLPIEEISEEEYLRLEKEFPIIDWEMLWVFDGRTDRTTSSREVACSAGICEWV